MAVGDIDREARDRALRVYALPVCCHIPIAARDEAAIEKYVGRIACVLRAASPNQALLVHPYDAPPSKSTPPDLGYARVGNFAFSRAGLGSRRSQTIPKGVYYGVS